MLEKGYRVCQKSALFHQSRLHHLKKQITDSLEARLEKQYRLIGHLYFNALREVFLNFGLRLKALTGKGLQEFTNLRNVGY
ncbi:hypothetical protein C1752_03752 [Acaryochloris thomasi RCC1774]|uniref:Uncharacterized protein n=1 Tax=Acaryochloris thomasi RCC1774 TaxID=1764569 RepID=A0A2W1JR04_9CYAN|nr:hypothetical protein C1752_03752 [Acaryochloris thomasi RCC1774]